MTVSSGRFSLEGSSPFGLIDDPFLSSHMDLTRVMSLPRTYPRAVPGL